MALLKCEECEKQISSTQATFGVCDGCRRAVFPLCDAKCKSKWLTTEVLRRCAYCTLESDAKVHCHVCAKLVDGYINVSCQECQKVYKECDDCDRGVCGYCADYVWRTCVSCKTSKSLKWGAWEECTDCNTKLWECNDCSGTLYCDKCKKNREDAKEDVWCHVCTAKINTLENHQYECGECETTFHLCDACDHCGNVDLCQPCLAKITRCDRCDAKGVMVDSIECSKYGCDKKFWLCSACYANKGEEPLCKKCTPPEEPIGVAYHAKLLETLPGEEIFEVFYNQSIKHHIVDAMNLRWASATVSFEVNKKMDVYHPVMIADGFWNEFCKSDFIRRQGLVCKRLSVESLDDDALKISLRFYLCRDASKPDEKGLDSMVAEFNKKRKREKEEKAQTGDVQAVTALIEKAIEEEMKKDNPALRKRIRDAKKAAEEEEAEIKPKKPIEHVKFIDPDAEDSEENAGSDSDDGFHNAPKKRKV